MDGRAKIERKIMTSQLESLIQQATQLERPAVCLAAFFTSGNPTSAHRCDSNRDERIELITHLANSLHSSNDPTSKTVLTDIQQSQLDPLSATLRERLRSEIEIGLEQVKAGNTVDGETVFANLQARIDGYRDLDAIFRSK
jgi:hypothetical protein